MIQKQNEVSFLIDICANIYFKEKKMAFVSPEIFLKSTQKMPSNRFFFHI
jgi:hypothetical protein